MTAQCTRPRDITAYRVAPLGTDPAGLAIERSVTMKFFRLIRWCGKALLSITERRDADTPAHENDRLDQVMHLANANEVVLIEIGSIGVPLALVFACGGYDRESDELIRRFLDGQVKPVCFDAMEKVMTCMEIPGWPRVLQR
jgi:hypothetical protein